MGRSSPVRLKATDARGDGQSGLGVGRYPSARSIETVYEKLRDTFGLRRERPQDTAGCASSSGGAGGAAQLPHLAQRTTQPTLGALADLLGWRSQTKPVR